MAYSTEFAFVSHYQSFEPRMSLLIFFSSFHYFSSKSFNFLILPVFVLNLKLLKKFSAGQIDPT